MRDKQGKKKFIVSPISAKDDHGNDNQYPDDDPNLWLSSMEDVDNSVDWSFLREASNRFNRVRLFWLHLTLFCSFELKSKYNNGNQGG